MAIDFYYLPHKSTGGYYPKVEYLEPQKIENQKDFIPTKYINNFSEIKEAKVTAFESIDDFHSCFPMDIISTKEEIVKHFKVFNKQFYLFPEYRDFPIKMKNYLPKRWTLDKNNINGLNDNVSKGEYYTFQVGLISLNKDIDDIDIIYTDLNSSSKGTIDKKYFTCFNKGGVDLDGKAFTKKVSVKMGEVQSLWFGLEIPLNTKSGTYNSLVIIKPKGMEEDLSLIHI